MKLYRNPNISQITRERNGMHLRWPIGFVFHAVNFMRQRRSDWARNTH